MNQLDQYQTSITQLLFLPEILTCLANKTYFINYLMLKDILFIFHNKH